MHNLNEQDALAQQTLASRSDNATYRCVRGKQSSGIIAADQPHPRFGVGGFYAGRGALSNPRSLSRQNGDNG